MQTPSQVQLSTRLDEAAEIIKTSGALLIGAGAGMGVDSGLPDFRGPQGFWRAYPVLAKLGISFENMANPAWFESDPHLAWAFYGHRLNHYRQTEPHEGFRLLLAAAKQKPQGYFVFTSNVDGHFEKAGYDPGNIVECHGSIHYLQCLRRCTETVWSAAGVEVKIDENRFRAVDALPQCLRCGALARPNILMFGDGDWIGDRTMEQESRMEAWLDQVKRSGARLAVIEMGAGTAIPSVRYLCEGVARRSGATLVRINPREPAAPSGQVEIPLGACEALKRLCGGP